jgi:hypothetical protein
MVKLEKNDIAQIQHVFGLDELIINNRLKHPVEITIGKSRRKYQVFKDVIAMHRDEGELKIGYFGKAGNFRIYSCYPYFYQPEYMVIAGKSFKTDSADKVRIALNYLEVILSLENLEENV